MKTGWQFKTTGYIKYRSKKKKEETEKKRKRKRKRKKTAFQSSFRLVNTKKPKTRS